MTQAIDRRAIIAGSIGNVLEWYDFAVYGVVAPIIAAQFFPAADPLTSLIAAFGVFAAGYMMRPLGALMLGHIGDRIGRKAALTWSIGLMAIPTGLIAVLPTYETIGIGAAILLTLLRLLQGLSVGGETTGAAVLLTERATKQSRGLIGSISTSSVAIGILIASAVAGLLASLLSPEALADWGWRLAFVPGPILGLLGVVLRRYILENVPPDDRSGVATLPIVESMRDHGNAMLRVATIVASVMVAFYTTFIYLTTYLTDVVRAPIAESLQVNTIAMALLAVLAPVAATVSDRVGRKPVMLAGVGALFVLSYPLFVLLHSGDTTLELIGDFTLTLIVAVYLGPLTAQMIELFPRRIRYTGVSVAYSLPVAVFGGTVPLVLTWLIATTGNDLSPAFYLMAFAGLGIVALVLTPETRDTDLD